MWTLTLLFLASLAIAMVAGLGIAVCIFKVANWLLRERRLEPRLGVWVSFLIGLFLLIPIFNWVAESAATKLIGMDPREGEQRLEFAGLPPNTTSDFCYYTPAGGAYVLADFEMSESDFLDWMDAKGWTVFRFDSSNEKSPRKRTVGELPDFWTVVHPVRDYHSGRPRKVTRGYYLNPLLPFDADVGLTIVYDLDTGRVFFKHTL